MAVIRTWWSDLVSRVREVYRGPLVVKLSLEAGNITAVARAAERAVPMPFPDQYAQRHGYRCEQAPPVLAIITGGLSARRCAPSRCGSLETAEAVPCPLSAWAAFRAASDALEFYGRRHSRGRGTANFVNPLSVRDYRRVAALPRAKRIAHYSALMGGRKR